MDGQQSKVTLGHAYRQQQQSTRLRDYVLHIVQLLSSSSSLSASSLDHTHSLGSPYPIAYYVNYNKFSLQHRAFLAATATGVKPSSFTEVEKDEK